MTFNKSLAIELDEKKLDFLYSDTLFHPKKSESRLLDDIRQSLKNPLANGPRVLYTIAMDVGKKKDQADLLERNLLYGIVAYNNGLIGDELIRSQGHIHAVSPSCQSSTPEVYEIWQGTAYIYMQEFVENHPGRCYAVWAKAGEIVIVPPGWAHYTVNGDITQKMVFGAWCIRDFGFVYDEVKKRKGLAHYPVVKKGQIEWVNNQNYANTDVVLKTPREYKEFGLIGANLYQQYEANAKAFDFVTNPSFYQEIWEGFTP